MQDTEEDVQNMADKKRRLTAPESPGRRNGPAQYTSSSTTTVGPSTGTSTDVAGSSWNTAIDLTDDSERPLPPPPLTPPTIRRNNRSIVATTSRRQSDIILPKWQADSDVSNCPVCQDPFTFWHRKHHCRKCGRVVCANCSPHRITIPRQFIVRPPNPPSALIDLTGDTCPASPTAPMQLWGGEEVRVCNPCVPDPNFSPPPRAQLLPDPILPEHWRFPSSGDLSGSLQQPRRARNISSLSPPLPPHASHRSTLSDAPSPNSGHNRRGGHNPFRTHRRNFPLPTSTQNLYIPPTLSHNILYPPRTSSSNFGASSSTSLPAPLAPYRNRPLIDIDRPLHSPVPPRRQIAEEDECPICGEELPPTGPNGETADREGHVEDCIGAHLYTASPPPRTFSVPPTDTAEGSSLASGSSATSVPMTPPSLPRSSSAPLRPRRMTGGRMLLYHATEKDCVGDDGAQECVICFEEFEEGDEMGRLECLCRFHRACIRQWWDTKGQGSCPTHQLHD